MRDVQKGATLPDGGIVSVPQPIFPPLPRVEGLGIVDPLTKETVMANQENATRNRQKQANQDSKMMRPMGENGKADNNAR